MILESIVTTVDRYGRVNIAPMGPAVGDDFSTASVDDLVFELRPFSSSQTYKNLLANHTATIHVTDNVDLFAFAVTGGLDDSESLRSMVNCFEDRFFILNDCHRWFAVEIEKNDLRPHDFEKQTIPIRYRLTCRVKHSGVVRPFFGFNRAKHAVVEAAILASRVGILPIDQIRAKLESLQPLVDKTGGQPEIDAFERVKRFVTQVKHDQSLMRSNAPT